MPADNSANLLFTIAGDASPGVAELNRFRGAVSSTTAAVTSTFAASDKAVQESTQATGVKMRDALGRFVGAGAVAAGEAVQKASNETTTAVGEGMKRAEYSTGQAKMAMRGLGTEVGVSMPRYVSAWLASLESVGPAMAAAFSAIAVVGLIMLVVKAGEQLVSFIGQIGALSAAEKKAFEENAKALVEVRDRRVEILKLAYAEKIAALEGIDTAAAHVEKARLQLALNRELLGISKDYRTEAQQRLSAINAEIGALVNVRDQQISIVQQYGSVYGPPAMFAEKQIGAQNKLADLQKEEIIRLEAVWKAQQEQVKALAETTKATGELGHVEKEIWKKAEEDFAKRHDRAIALRREMETVADAARKGAEELANQMAAIFALPLKQAQVTAELYTRIAQQQATNVYDARIAALDREVESMREGYKKENTLTAENEALLVQYRRESIAKIEREREAADDRELTALDRDILQIQQRNATSFERLAIMYQRDALRFSAAEELKAVTALGAEANIQAMRERFAAAREALDDRYDKDLQQLENSEGWQGVFGQHFAQQIRGDEDLLDEWADTENQAAMMLAVTYASLGNTMQRAFAQFAQGMGQNIAHAIVYSKSIGEAMRAAAAATLQSIAAESLVNAIYSAALGFLSLAKHDYPAAAAAFKAAGLFGGVGVVAAIAGRAIAPKEESGTGAGAGAGAAAGAGGGTAAASSLQSAAPSGPRISIVINGHIIGQSGIEELTSMINDAVQSRDVRLVATQTRQLQPAIR